MIQVVVFDTNVLLSALLSLHGSPFRCLALAKTGVVKSVTCQQILDEFQEKLVVKFAFEPRQAHKAADEIRNCSQVVTIYNTINVVTADPDDDKIL